MICTLCSHSQGGGPHGEKAGGRPEKKNNDDWGMEMEMMEMVETTTFTKNSTAFPPFP